jgi:beta-xylosidase
VQASLILLPETNDEFSTAGLKNQWEWNYQPRDDKWSLTEKKGWLRLHAFKPLSNDDLFKAGNTLTQRSWRTGFNTVIIKISVSGMADGQKAGLCHFAFPQYASLGVVAKGEKRFLQYRNGSKHIDGPLLRQSTIWLKSTWGLQGVSRFAYSLDGKKFIGFGDSYQLAWGAYRGDRVGIYCYNNKGGKGYADIDFFHYERSKKEETALANGHHYK